MMAIVLVAATSVFRIGGHSHTCPSAEAEQSVIEAKLAEWAKRNRVDAMGLGSPWTAENARTAAYVEKEWRDNYYAGVTEGAKRTFDMDEVESKLDKINRAPGNETLYYLDNETPKQRYGHLWHVGFKATVPSWHDYDQGLRARRRASVRLADGRDGGGASVGSGEVTAAAIAMPTNRLREVWCQWK